MQTSMNYNESFDFTACERYDVTFAEGNAPTKVDATLLIRSAMSKVKALKNKIIRAIELQRSQVLQTGVVLLKNGDSIDFKRKAQSLKVLSGTARWSEISSADPLADLTAGMEFIREEGISGGTEIDVIFGSQALINFKANAKIQKLLESRREESIRIDMPKFNNVSGMVSHGKVAAGDYTINMWTYNVYYVDPVTKVNTKYIDPNNVIMIADDFVGFTAFAGVPAIMGDNVSGQFIAPKEGEFYVRDVIDQVKMSWNFIISSAPLVVPVSIDRFVTIKTA
jgi:hypothetical protein